MSVPYKTTENTFVSHYMSQDKKYFLLIVPVLPPITLLVINIPVVKSTINNHGLDYILFTLFIISISLFGLILYVKHLLTNKSISRDTKAIWVFSFVIFQSITQVIYWFKYIRTKEQ